MRQAVFLRAINVGTHNRIKMTDLRAVCEGAGFAGVATYLQSGNLLFEDGRDSETVAAVIEAALAERGLRNAAAIVRTLDELDELLTSPAFEPYPAEQYTPFVTFFRHELAEAAARLLRDDPATVLVRPREVLSVLPVVRPPGVDVNGGLEKRLKAQATTRYRHVVEEMARLLRG